MQYLSPEWIAAVNEALAGSEKVAAATAGKSLTMQQFVEGGPDGDHASYLRIDDGTAAFVAGEAPDADFSVRTDYETSFGLQTGTVNEMAAAMSGKVKPSGNLSAAMTMQAALKAVDEVTKSVEVSS